jgi:predicted transposase YbfD/YdcC
MDATGALGEAIVFLEHFGSLPDPRQQGKVIYPLDEVLLLCLVAVLAGAESFVEIARFGTKKLDLLRRFRPFTHGTPSHDQLGAIFATLDAEQFQQCFVAWVAALTGAPAGVIAIDGKTVRRSHHKKTGQAAIHMVSAFAARQRLVLGQVKVDEKSNEIVAIPKLLAMLSLEGAIVTIDAIGCQRDIARTIIDKKADYVLALKSLLPRRREATRPPCTMTSSCSWPNRRNAGSRTRRSRAIRRSMVIMAASKPARPRSSTTSPGSRRFMTGRG